LGANTGTTSSQSLIPYTNSTAIGYGAKIDASNQIVLGTIKERVDIRGSLYVNGAQITNISTSVSSDDNNNTKIGSATTIPTQAVNKSTAIGYGAIVNASNQIVLGTSTEFVCIPKGLSIGKTTAPGVGSYFHNLALDISGAIIVSDNIYVGDSLQFKNGVRIGINTQTSLADNNISVGDYSLKACVDFSSYGNVAVGKASLSSTTSYYNTAIGDATLMGNITGINNTAIGSQAGRSRVIESDGTLNMYYNQFDTSGCNTFLGADTFIVYGTNENIQKSTAIGFEARIDASNQIVLGTINEFVCIPSNRGLSIGKTTAPTSNYALDISGSISVTGDYKSDVSFNTKIGTYALTTNTTGYDNTAVGKTSLWRNTTGYSNTAVGNLSLWGNTTGAKNTAIGFEAGRTNDTLNNTFLGAYTDISSNATNITNSTALGYNAKIDASNQIVLGTSGEFVCIPSNRGLSIGKATAPTSNYALDVSGSINFLEGIYKNGVPFVSGSSSSNSISSGLFVLGDISGNGKLDITGDISGNSNLSVRGSVGASSYNATSDYRIKDNVRNLDEQDTISNLRPVKYFNKQTNKNDFGLIAHELQSEYPDLVSGEKDGQELQSVNYIGLISVLIKEVQELKQITAEQAIEISTFKKG
jgi:hypothetical protein